MWSTAHDPDIFGDVSGYEANIPQLIHQGCRGMDANDIGHRFFNAGADELEIVGPPAQVQDFYIMPTLYGRGGKRGQSQSRKEGIDNRCFGAPVTGLIGWVDQ